MNAYRELRLPQPGAVDFCSNDYLGIVKNGLLSMVNGELSIDNKQLTINNKQPLSGATGSRLLAGNYKLIEEAEQQIAAFHGAEAALIFNSGYDANIGLLASVPQKGDTIIYDSLSHASIRDGIRLSFAQAYSFLHNNLNELEKKLQQATGNIFVVTESVFSMDGDTCPLKELISLCEKYSAHLIVDEAHATGVMGGRGEGLVQHLKCEESVFARVHTYGKACGCHGAAVLGSTDLRHYLINFSRSFIYSTALPPHAINFIQKSYDLFPSMMAERAKLQTLIRQFQEAAIGHEKLISVTPIQAVIVPGNAQVRSLADKLQHQKLDVRPILYPTVPKGKERLRIVLHAFNTAAEMQLLINTLQ